MQVRDIESLSSFKTYEAYRHKSPCFLFEKRLLVDRARAYLSALKESSNSIEPYYAVKSNHYSGILSTLVALGYGLDASSRRELVLALQSGARKVIYTGPGKTVDDLAFAIDNFDDLVINLDSFGELERLKTLRPKRQVNICVRINTANHGGWKKFGIPLVRLKQFYTIAKSIPNVSFRGVHFHNSWNTDSSPYLITLRNLESYLLSNFSNEELQDYKILDIGGGLYCDRVEGYLRTKDGTDNDFFNRLIGYELVKSQNIESIVRDIDGFINNSVFKSISGFTMFTEPGRWLNTYCMHILLQVIDKKDDRLAILNGGTENFGFVTREKFYYPMYNLSHPGEHEMKIVMAGSLCSIDDIWGYFCYGEDLELGDAILLPFQGSYTYAYSKDFIHPIPSVYVVE